MELKLLTMSFAFVLCYAGVILHPNCAFHPKVSFQTHAQRPKGKLCVCNRQNCLRKPVTKTSRPHLIVEHASEQAGQHLQSACLSFLVSCTPWACLHCVSPAEICAKAFGTKCSTFTTLHSMNELINTCYIQSSRTWLDVAHDVVFSY